MDHCLRVPERRLHVDIDILRGIAVRDVAGMDDPRLVEMGVPADVDVFPVQTVSHSVKIHVHALLVVPVDKKAKPPHLLRDPDRHPARQVAAFIGLLTCFQPAIGQVVLIRSEEHLPAGELRLRFSKVRAEHIHKNCPHSVRIGRRAPVKVAGRLIFPVEFGDPLPAVPLPVPRDPQSILKISLRDHVFGEEVAGILDDRHEVFPISFFDLPKRQIDTFKRRVLFLAIQRVQDVHDRVRADGPGVLHEPAADLLVRVSQPQEPADHAQHHSGAFRDEIKRAFAPRSGSLGPSPDLRACLF